MTVYSNQWDKPLDAGDDDAPPDGKHQLLVVFGGVKDAKKGQGDSAKKIGDVFEWELETLDDTPVRFKYGQWMTKDGKPDGDKCRFIGRNWLRAGVACDGPADFFDEGKCAELTGRIVNVTIKRSGEKKYVNIYFDSLVSDGRVRLSAEQEQYNAFAGTSAPSYADTGAAEHPALPYATTPAEAGMERDVPVKNKAGEEAPPF